MKASHRAIEIIKRYEGLRLTAYLCPAGKWTIGWGHTKGVKQGDTITKAKAEEFLRTDLDPIERELSGLGLDFNQNQFDSLVSFVFNVGWSAFRSSTLLKQIRRNINGEWFFDTNGIRTNSIAVQFRRWKFGGGKVLPGLIRRREEEAGLYLNQNEK